VTTQELLAALKPDAKADVMKQLGASPADPPKREQQGRGQSKLEQAYQRRLDSERHNKQIVTFSAHPEPLLLADRCTYQPDFSVQQLDGRTRFDEVKGARVWEDSVVKFKVAAEMYPQYVFRMVKRVKGEWVTVREYPKVPRVRVSRLAGGAAAAGGTR
jgi:hypothetical protein